MQLSTKCVCTLSLVYALICISNQAAAQDASATPKVSAYGNYCPVCMTNMKKWMKGNPEYSVVYDGQVYYFPGEAPRVEFLTNPVKYAPALGGDCVVCFAEMGKRMAGSIKHGAMYRGRVFLFPSNKQKEMFRANPAQYANADLAFSGDCAVCLVEMKQRMPGKEEYAVVHEGFRYYFPGEKQRDMFLANPDRYKQRPDTEVLGLRAPETSPVKATRRVTILGTSACAGCEFGVSPLRTPSELGLAVSADDGKVYVVEEAHKLYPNLYEKRFDGIALKAHGTVVSEKGRFVWIDPQTVTQVN